MKKIMSGLITFFILVYAFMPIVWAGPGGWIDKGSVAYYIVTTFQAISVGVGIACAIFAFMEKENKEKKKVYAIFSVMFFVIPLLITIFIIQPYPTITAD